LRAAHYQSAGLQTRALSRLEPERRVKRATAQPGCNHVCVRPLRSDGSAGSPNRSLSIGVPSDQIRHLAVGSSPPFRDARSWSGSAHKSWRNATVPRCPRIARSDHCQILLFNQLVGAEKDCRAEVHPEALGELGVDCQIQLRRTLDRQLGYSRPFEDSVHIVGGAAE
jgi:hypothetical protein